MIFPIYHSIIRIGALVASRTANGWEVQAVGAPWLFDYIAYASSIASQATGIDPDS
jgi:hypothetical protein